jgi:RNA polymerase sigma-70 factor (ECF subfamily)
MLLVENRGLLDRFRRGEPAALAEVCRAYAAGVARLLRLGFDFQSDGRQCRFHGMSTEFDLEDRLHDVFTRAFSEQARLGYDGLTPYATYLRTIAKNLIIDDFRRKERALTEYSIELVEAAVAPRNESGGDPEREASTNELADLVARFEATLSERERTIYRLRFRDELEHRDIVERTGLSESKVKTSEKRIRVAFFEFMKRHGYFEGYRQDRKGWLRSLFI